MRTDPKQSDENREEAGLEEALKLWVLTSCVLFYYTLFRG